MLRKCCLTRLERDSSMRSSRTGLIIFLIIWGAMKATGKGGRNRNVPASESAPMVGRGGIHILFASSSPSGRGRRARTAHPAVCMPGLVRLQTGGDERECERECVVESVRQSTGYGVWRQIQKRTRERDSRTVETRSPAAERLQDGTKESSPRTSEGSECDTGTTLQCSLLHGKLADDRSQRKPIASFAECIASTSIYYSGKQTMARTPLHLV